MRKSDWITRSLMGAIALFLGFIAFGGAGSAESTAAAQKAPGVVDPKFAHLQISGDQSGFYLFDHSSGRIWYYSAQDFRANPEDVGQLEEPGRRLAR